MRTLVGRLVVLFAFCATTFAAEVGKQAKQLEKATDVLNEIMETPDKSIPSDLLQKSVCVGVVPSEIKGAFVVGGTYGRGVLVCRKHGDGPWGAPSLFTLGGANIGFQIGGEATDVVFLVMNPAGAKKLLQDKVSWGPSCLRRRGRWAAQPKELRTRSCTLRFSATRGPAACLPEH